MWDEDLGTWKNKPRHDWASHGADAFRYLALAYKEDVQADNPKPPIEGGVDKLTLNRLFDDHSKRIHTAAGMI
jgi:hypothetical protein